MVFRLSSLALRVGVGLSEKCQNYRVDEHPKYPADDILGNGWAIRRFPCNYIDSQDERH